MVLVVRWACELMEKLDLMSGGGINKSKWIIY